MRNALLTTASAAVIAIGATAAGAQQKPENVQLENCYGVSAGDLETLQGLDDTANAGQRDADSPNDGQGRGDQPVTADASASMSGGDTGRRILVLPGAADSNERGDPGVQQGEMIPTEVPAKRLDAAGQAIASDPNQTLEAREQGPGDGNVQELDGNRQASNAGKAERDGTTGVMIRQGDMEFAEDETEEGGLTDQQVAENYKQWRETLSASQTDDGQTASVDGTSGTETTTSEQEDARRALTVARAVMPEVEFTHWRRGQAVTSAYVFTGEHSETGRQLAVHVNRDGRISEIEEQIPLRAMPRPLRELVGTSLNGLRVADTQRSIREDFDVYYEIDGVLRSGRPVQVEIRSDGHDFTLSSPVNG